MNILYDYQIFLDQQVGGISRYFANLIQGIEQRDDVFCDVAVYRNSNRYLSDKYARKLGFFERKKCRRKHHLFDEYNRNLAIKALESGKIDVFHPTYFDPYYLGKTDVPFVITVHDMIYEKFPQFFGANDPVPFHKRLLIEKADKIIAISHQTKKDILYFNDIDEHKIHVVHHGIDTDIPPLYEDIVDLPEQYILYVGSRFGYKNFPLLVEAFSQLVQNRKDLHLVLVGGLLGSSEKELLYRYNVLDKVRCISATDSQLNMLYRKAVCFVYPSLYEGFGLPILEAFKNDCAVLLSRASCFPEIAADAAAYFESQSMESLVCELQDLIDNKSNRDILIEKGRERIKNFTIETCVQDTLNVYKRVV